VRAEILIFAGVDELDVIGPFEVLATAAELGGDVEVALVRTESMNAVEASHGISLTPHALLGAAPDLLVVPGGGWAAKAKTGAWGEYQRGKLPMAVAERHASGSVVAGVCTGALLMAATGLLKGRPAVTHTSALEDLADAEAVVVDARVVDDGDVLTCGGVTSGIDLALWVVERELGADLAARVAAQLEHERRGTVHRTAA
jgi:transcriptional regulator GlxA family with amidase domain